MVTVREIYDNKTIIGQREDFDNLIKSINEKEEDLLITDNYDRTLTLHFSDTDQIQRFQDVFGEVLQSWLEREITCPIQYVYNLLPLNQTQSLLRI